MSGTLKAHLMVLLATLLVAGSFIVSKKLAGVIHPISLNLLRFSIASLVLAPFILLNAIKRAKIVTVLPRTLIISFFMHSTLSFFLKRLSTHLRSVQGHFTLLFHFLQVYYVSSFLKNPSVKNSS